MAIFDFNNLSSLSDVELSVYRFVVNNPEKVAYMRVRDIAKKTHVANSSVMRFVHKIGFASFPEFKAYLKNINQTVAPQKALTFIDQQNFPNDIENKLRVVADQLYSYHGNWQFCLHRRLCCKNASIIRIQRISYYRSFLSIK